MGSGATKVALPRGNYGANQKSPSNRNNYAVLPTRLIPPVYTTSKHRGPRRQAERMTRPILETGSSTLSRNTAHPLLVLLSRSPQPPSSAAPPTLADMAIRLSSNPVAIAAILAYAGLPRGTNGYSDFVQRAMGVSEL